MSTPSTSPAESGRLVVDFGRMGSRLGLALAGIGLLVIGFGWNGAASNDLVVEQLPYILSGGILGIALVIIGAAYTIVQNAREDSARLEARIADLLEVVVSSRSTAGAALTAAAPAPRDLSSLVAAGTASYHAPTCRLVDGRESTNYLTPTEARGRGLKACRVCKPQGAEAPDVTIS